MGLSSDEQKLLDELTAKASQPDADETFEIEVYDTSAGKGARIPFSKGKSWLFETFGIGDAPAAPPEGAPDGGGASGTDAAPGGTGGASQPGYFGRKDKGKS